MSDPALLELLRDMRDVAAETRDAQLRATVHLARLVNEVAGLRADLAECRPTKRSRAISAGDGAALTALLPRIEGAIGAEAFTVKRMRELVTETTETAALTAMQVGKLLTRAARSETCVAGLFVRIVGRSGDGMLLSVSTERHSTMSPRDSASILVDAARS